MDSQPTNCSFVHFLLMENKIQIHKKEKGQELLGQAGNM